MARRTEWIRLSGSMALSMTMLGSMAVTAPAAMIAQAATQPGTAARQVGTVKSIEGSTIMITTAAGAPISVTLAPETTVLQLPAGSTDLKSATPASAASISVGDRILVSGKPGESAAAIAASRVILMKSSDIAARNQAQQADWQKRGISGLVKSVDGDVLTIGVGQRTVKVQTTSTTIFRRYALDSVNFQDAKPGTLGSIHAGDQLTVRGPHADDNLAITAEEIVSGKFENLSGVLTAVNTSEGTISLKDLASKRDVIVKITTNSDLRKLPASAAAAFTNRGAGEATGAAARPTGAAAPAAGASAGAVAPGSRARAGMDLSRMLARLPVEQLAEMKPGEAVMIVASEGRSTDALTAITLLSGVEQLLSSTSASSAPITLSPWNLGAPDAGGGGPQ